MESVSKLAFFCLELWKAAYFFGKLCKKRYVIIASRKAYVIIAWKISDMDRKSLHRWIVRLPHQIIDLKGASKPAPRRGERHDHRVPFWNCRVSSWAFANLRWKNLFKGDHTQSAKGLTPSISGRPDTRTGRSSTAGSFITPDQRPVSRNRVRGGFMGYKKTKTEIPLLTGHHSSTVWNRYHAVTAHGCIVTFVLFGILLTRR